MDVKILKTDDSIERLQRLANARVEKGDHIGALGFLFRARAIDENNLDVIMDVADVYSDMELYELSNKFWYIYLSKAPEDKVSVAYEEIGINFFYMDNIYVSSYYFQKKFSMDGYFSSGDLDREIVEYFSQAFESKEDYKIAYPPERADYSNQIKDAKRKLAAGDYEGAEEILEKIPAGCAQYEEALSERAMLKFLDADFDGSIELSRYQLSEVGESVSAYCSMSSAYLNKKDIDKSRYYYLLSLSQPIKDLSDYYKLATCSLEQREHEKASGYLQHIIKEHPNDLTMRYLYALSLINCNKFELAQKELNYLITVKPWDSVVKYYAALAVKLEADGDKNGLLPLEYTDGLPMVEEVRRLAIIKDLPSLETDKINRALKNPSTFECVTWGITSHEESIAKACILSLVTSTLKKAQQALLDLFIDANVSSRIKEIVLYVLVVSGYKKPIPIVKSQLFDKVKPKKMRFQNMPEYEVFSIAYALCLSRVAFSGVSDYDKVAFAAERVFKRLKDKLSPENFGTEELAVLILTECKYKEVNYTNAYRLFGADKKKVKNLQLLMEKKDD